MVALTSVAIPFAGHRELAGLDAERGAKVVLAPFLVRPGVIAGE
jgi:hypothetical protein